MYAAMRNLCIKEDGESYEFAFPNSILVRTLTIVTTCLRISMEYPKENLLVKDSQRPKFEQKQDQGEFLINQRYDEIRQFTENSQFKKMSLFLKGWPVRCF